MRIAPSCTINDNSGSYTTIITTARKKSVKWTASFAGGTTDFRIDKCDIIADAEYFAGTKEDGWY